jgi:hypothetical protein
MLVPTVIVITKFELGRPTCVSSLGLPRRSLIPLVGFRRPNRGTSFGRANQTGKAHDSAQRTKSEPKAISHNGYNDPDPSHFETGRPPRADGD